MRRFARLILVLCLTLTLPVSRAAATQLNYTLYVLGLPVADASLLVDMNVANYRAEFRYHTTGLADLVASDRMDETISGKFVGGRPFSQDYNSRGHLKGNDRLVVMTWHDGTPIAKIVSPPNSTERDLVPPAQLAHVSDPLSAIVLLLHQAGQTGRCEVSARTFDGRRLQQYEAKTAGEEDVPPSIRSSFSGRGLRCDFTDQTIAGFRVGSGREASMRRRKGTIWLSRIVTGGPLLPVRASVETRWLGDAIIYLTSFSP